MKLLDGVTVPAPEERKHALHRVHMLSERVGAEGCLHHGRKLPPVPKDHKVQTPEGPRTQLAAPAESVLVALFADGPPVLRIGGSKRGGAETGGEQ